MNKTENLLLNSTLSKKRDIFVSFPILNDLRFFELVVAIALTAVTLIFPRKLTTVKATSGVLVEGVLL